MTRFVELCSGIGGFSLAATWMGWDVIGQVEIDPWCRRVLAKHWPDALRLEDLREVKGDEWGAVDVVAGGIPCQPFSVAGKQGGAADDRHLWPEVARILAVMRPQVVVVENVSGFVRLALDDVLADLEAQGYACGTVVLPACGVGAPHRRDRVWVVAHAEGRGAFGQSEGHGHARMGLAGSGGGLTGGSGLAVSPSLAHTRRRDGGGRSDTTGGHVTDGHHAGWQETPGRAHERGTDAADAAGQCGTEQHEWPHEPREYTSRRRDDLRPGISSGRWDIETQSRLGIPHDGLSRWLDGRHLDPRWGGDPMRAFDETWEDGVPRVVTDCVDRTHKLKALGNALIPQVAFQIFQAIEA